MDESKFTNPNGRFEYNEQLKLTFMPKDLPPDIPYDGKLVALVAKAERKAGQLRGIGNRLSNPRILIRAHLKMEAVQSSKIEGTMASLEDLNRHEAVGNTDKEELDQLRLKEVINYVRALEKAIEEIRREGMIDLKLMLDAHKTLLQDVRGGDKSPGKFRTTQNMIVMVRNSKQEVAYVPPPSEHIHKLLTRLVSFMHTSHESSPLIQCAMIHYQFEAIHPFRDGNGRIGRLILPLLLHTKDVLPDPLLYLSSYFEEHRQEYYDHLLAVSQKSDWYGWIEFFMTTTVEQADRTIRNIEGLLGVHEEYKNMLKPRRGGSKPVYLLDHFIENPFITIPTAQKILNTTYPTAKNAIQALIDTGILSKYGTFRGKKVYRAAKMAEVLGS